MSITNEASTGPVTKKVFTLAVVTISIVLCTWTFFNLFIDVTRVVNSYGPMAPAAPMMSEWTKTSTEGQASLAILNIFYASCFVASFVALFNLRKE